MSKRTLKNANVIISYRGNTPEREENLYAILKHYDLTYQDYRILLIEADDAPTFDWNILSDSKIQHLFIPNSGAFPKALLYNTAAKLSNSDVLIFNDADCFADPSVLDWCVFDLLTHSPDGGRVLCPYHETIDIAGGLRQKFIESPIYEQVQDVNKGNLEEGARLLYEANSGGVFVFNRKDFIRLGGLNTQFLGWGGEDSELVHRTSRLGLSWISFTRPLFHLHHDSVNRAEWGHVTDEGRANATMANDVQTMPIEELQALADELHQFFV